MMDEALRHKVTSFVEQEMPRYHEALLGSLRKLRLRKLLSRKNPYLFRIKNLNTASDLVDAILTAHLSSQEETKFGEVLERLARVVCEHTYGRDPKSSAEGIDLEFDRDGHHYIVAVKSGPNWGNSGQIKRMLDNFRKARRILGTTGGLSRTSVVAINGCCYGRCDEHRGDYLKLCGQSFWRLISGSDSFYVELVEPLAHKASEYNDRFIEAKAEVVNKLTKELLDDFCQDGSIDWKRLVEFNSGAK